MHSHVQLLILRVLATEVVLLWKDLLGFKFSCEAERLLVNAPLRKVFCPSVYCPPHS